MPVPSKARNANEDRSRSGTLRGAAGCVTGAGAGARGVSVSVVAVRVGERTVELKSGSEILNYGHPSSSKMREANAERNARFQSEQCSDWKHSCETPFCC